MLSLEAKERVLDEVAAFFRSDFTETVDAANVDADIVDRYTEQALESTDFGNILAPIRQLISDSADLEEVRDKLFSLYSELPSSDFAELMGSAIAAAELAGRYEVIQEGEDPEFAEALELLKKLDLALAGTLAPEPEFAEALELLRLLDANPAEFAEMCRGDRIL